MIHKIAEGFTLDSGSRLVIDRWLTRTKLTLLNVMTVGVIERDVLRGRLYLSRVSNVHALSNVACALVHKYYTPSYEQLIFRNDGSVYPIIVWTPAVANFEKGDTGLQSLAKKGINDA